MTRPAGGFMMALALPQRLARSTLSRWIGLLNPVVLTIGIASVAMLSGSEATARFVVPAAPNLAHVLFFVFVASSGGRASIRGGNFRPPV